MSPLAGIPAPLGAGSGLYDLEEREAHRLLKLGIAVELDVCAVPDVVEIRALRGQQAVPPVTLRRRQRGVDLVAQCGHRTAARPAVSEQLHDREGLAWLELGADRDPREVGLALRRGHRPGRPVDDVVEGGRHPQVAGPRAMTQGHLDTSVRVVLGDEGGAERGRRAGIVRSLRNPLVGDERRLDDDPHGGVERFDLVPDRRDGAMVERDQTGRVDADGLVPTAFSSGGRGAVHPHESRGCVRG